MREQLAGPRALVYGLIFSLPIRAVICGVAFCIRLDAAPDSPLTDSQRAAWAEYRQALRDLPGLAETPESVVFPGAPV